VAVGFIIVTDFSAKDSPGKFLTLNMAFLSETPLICVLSDLSINMDVQPIDRSPRRLERILEPSFLEKWV
jgi:hypothetical protein